MQLDDRLQCLYPHLCLAKMAIIRCACWSNERMAMNLQVLYPLFVYSYLDTVKQKQSMRAREMMRHVKARFLECEGASISLAKELEDLATVLYPQHLQNPVPKAVRLQVIRFCYKCAHM
jgi:hypothetical protein